MSDKKKKYILVAVQLVAAAGLALLDQLFKRLAVEHLMNKAPVVLIPDVLDLYYSTNTGGAWSILDEHPAVLYTLTAILLIGIVAFLLFGKIEGKVLNICVVLILGGGIGNMIDRLSQGYVVDYIRTLFIDFPIFNFADILVVVGAFTVCGVLIYQMIREEKMKKREKSGESDHGNS